MTSVLHVVDSSGWIEMLTNGPQAERFLEALDDEKSLIVPSITVLKCSSGSAWTQRGTGDPGNNRDALRLLMAVSIILTTARQHQARLFSMDADFKGLADVELILKMC